MKPIVALIGRPNVGKSTFFNRITRTRSALVENFPGVTRDRNYGDATWNDIDFIIIDTGGYTNDPDDNFAEQIRFQVSQSIEEADSIILLLDGKHGVSPFDSDIIKLLRPVDKKVFYAVNKIDSPEQEDKASDFYSAGIEKYYSISAEHGYGISHLMDNVVKYLPPKQDNSTDDIIRIAVIGKPNAGKSSLINKVLGKNRVLVSEIPGTTRDSVDIICKVNKKKYLLVDTAGIRRKSKVKKKIEKFSIIKTLKSLDNADISLIVLDANEGITEQDISIAGYAHDRGRACIFLLNKWDIVPKDHNSAKNYITQLQHDAKFLSFAPAITISALTGLRIHKIFNTIDMLYEQYTTRIGTGRLNRIFESAVNATPPALVRGRRLKFYYTTQISSSPPTFVSFVNYPDAVHFSYKRYLVNQLRLETGLNHTPIRLFFRKRQSH